MDKISKESKLEIDNWIASIIQNLNVRGMYLDYVEYDNEKGESMLKKYNDGRLWVSNERIYHIIEMDYLVKYIFIEEYLKEVFLKHFKFNVSTIIRY